MQVLTYIPYLGNHGLLDDSIISTSLTELDEDFLKLLVLFSISYDRVKPNLKGCMVRTLGALMLVLWFVT